MINPDFVRDFTTGGRQRYAEKDTILYALGVGVRVGEADFKYVYEACLEALPTLAVVLAREPFWLTDPQAGIDVAKLLHGEQSLTIHKPLPVAAEVRSELRVEGLYDKGPDKGAILDMRRELFEAESGDHLATIGIRSMLRGDGGFGGDSVGLPEPHRLPAGAPDIAFALPTYPEQALIYRLSGDLNPIHIDPAVGQRAGFPGPVLHGLCTYGIACRALVHLLLDDEPARLSRLDARFSSPVFPGDTITTEIWHEGKGQAGFRCRVEERDAIVINNGLACYD